MVGDCGSSGDGGDCGSGEGQCGKVCRRASIVGHL